MTTQQPDCARTYLDCMMRESRLLDCDAIEQYAAMLHDAWMNRRQVFVFGNGGSAFTAGHHVCDYVKTAAVVGQPRLKAFSLVENIGLVSALGNDLDFDQTMSYTLQSFAQAGDIAVAISCSGNSTNVLNACQWACDNGLSVVALTGFAGGALASLADIHINVPSENYGIIEDLHMSIGHIAAQLLKQRIASSVAEVTA